MHEDHDPADRPVSDVKSGAAPAYSADFERLGAAIGLIAAEVQLLERLSSQVALWERITRHIAAGNDIAVLGRAMAVLARKSEAPPAEEARHAA